MDTHLQPVSWDWLKAVLVSTLAILMITGGIMMPIEKLLEPRKLDRLPDWSRWLLLLPVAFASGFLAEIVPRMLFALMEIVVNHELLFRPGFDFVVWQLWAPLFFVAGGVQMAPRFKFAAFLVVGGLKIVIAGTNLYRDLVSVTRGTPWSAVELITNSPIWWNAIVYVLCIASLGALGFFLAKQSKEQRPTHFVSAIQ